MKARLVVLLLAVFLFYISVFTGSFPLEPGDILQLTSLESQVLFSLRLPRTVVSFFAGAILALGGLVLQNIFRNDLMTPYTLGISSAAVLGVGVAIELQISNIWLIEAFGFFGAASSIVFLLFLARFLSHRDTTSILLLGIALSMFYNAALTVLFYLGDPLSNDVLLRYSMGSLSVVGWEEPLAVVVCAVIFSGVVFLLRTELSLIALSHEYAIRNGVALRRVVFILLGVTSLSVGVLISITGPIGFVGLVVPHVVKKLYAKTLTERIVQTAIFGGLFLSACDVLARILQPQNEIPVGIVSACIGTPFFVYLIFRKRKN